MIGAPPVYSATLAGMMAETPTVQVIQGPSRNIPASAPTDRKKRRALVKAIGARQFKKLYKKAQV